MRKKSRNYHTAELLLDSLPFADIFLSSLLNHDFCNFRSYLRSTISSQHTPRLEQSTLTCSFSVLSSIRSLSSHPERSQLSFASQTADSIQLTGSPLSLFAPLDSLNLACHTPTPPLISFPSPLKFPSSASMSLRSVFLVEKMRQQGGIERKGNCHIGQKSEESRTLSRE